MFEVFKTAYFAGLGASAAAATGLILWGLYDVPQGIVASIRIAYRQWRETREGAQEPPTI